MKLQTIFQPKTTLSHDEVRHGLRALIWEGMASSGFSSVTTSTFLVAFALTLGANNFQIGILASLPFITDLLQIPAVWLVERIRRRKAIVIITWLVSQLLWIPIALIPIVMDIPNAGAISILLGLMAVRGILNAFTNCGWASWKRDLVPQNILGRYLARRLSLATVVAVILGLSAGFFIDRWSAGEGGAIGYSIVLLTGLVFFGLASPVLMVLVPEPRMPPATELRSSFSQTISAPLREPNFRHFMKFLLFWGFASNIALPFLAVFMLRYLNLPILTVIALTIVSEVFTIISLRFWGPLADRFGSKVVLYLSTSFFLLVLLGWIFSVIPGTNTLIVPMLAILHVFLGIAVAGISLTVETLSFKLAPHGRATSYLTGASLAESAGTGLGALAGGFLAELLSGHTYVLDMSRVNFFQGVHLDNIQITGYHFLFIIAFMISLITLRILNPVMEKGVTRREAILPVLIADIGKLFNQVNRGLNLSNLNIYSACCLRRVPETDGVIGIGTSRFNKSRIGAHMMPTVRSLLEEEPPSRICK